MAMTQSDGAPAQVAGGAEGGKVYEVTIDLTQDNASQSKLIRFILEDRADTGARVLDVGCANGALGEILVQKGCEVEGVELSEAAAEIARSRLGAVFCGSLDDYLDRQKPSKPFDYIVFGDVLEHLVDPAGTLRRLTAILAPGGAVVASLPNVAHLAVRAMLAEGRWDYDDEGLLDRTHLRFFTRQSLLALFAEAGYAVARIEPVTLPPEQAGIRFNRLLSETIDAMVEDDTKSAFQFVVLARPLGQHAEGTIIKAEQFDRAKVEAGSADGMLVARLEERLNEREAKVEELEKHLAEVGAGFENAMRVIEVRDEELAVLRAQSALPTEAGSPVAGWLARFLMRLAKRLAR